MYLMYVDESGDPGLHNSPTRYFALSGLVVHESEWRNFIDTLINFKKILNSAYGLPIRTEIHASDYINKSLYGIQRHSRLAILRNFIDEIAKMRFVSITNIIVNKSNKGPSYDVLESAWKILFQRFENTLNHGNFPGGFRNDFGLVLTDNTDGHKLTRLMRKMAVHNIVPHDPMFGFGGRNTPIRKIIEDPHPKNSRDSLPIQACDVCAYFLYQKYSPNSYIKKKNAVNYFDRLNPVLNLRASRSNRYGIVEL